MTYSAQIFRPVIIYGAGIHLAHAEKEAIEYARRKGEPVAPTWAALDLFPHDDPLLIGSFGTHGTRAGNFAVQNATHISAFGTRLDSKATGTPIESFARKANIMMVDIDQAEINKFGSRVTGVCEDVKSFLRNNMAGAFRSHCDEWLNQIRQWKEKYPVVKPEYYQEEGVNPYVFIKTLSEACEEGEIICTDTGCAVAWVSQGWIWKKGQRFIHAFNQTPMGYALPAAVGACYATTKRVVCISGDGSLMMSVGELATIAGHKLPIKIFMFNNQGHGMCRQTQREWLGGTYPSTSLAGGLTFPDFRAWAQGCGNHISTRIIAESDFANSRREVKHISMRECIEAALSDVGSIPTFTEIIINPEHEVVPKVKYGHSNEDAHPLLSREELEGEMYA